MEAAVAVIVAAVIAAAVVDCYVFVTPSLDFDGAGRRRCHPRPYQRTPLIGTGTGSLRHRCCLLLLYPSSSSSSSSSSAISLIAVISLAAANAAIALSASAIAAVAVVIPTVIATSVVIGYGFVTPLLDLYGAGHMWRHP